MRRAQVTLDDKYLLEDGRVFITGAEALIRIDVRASLRRRTTPLPLDIVPCRR
jgi:hypothetical protein